MEGSAEVVTGEDAGERARHVPMRRCAACGMSRPKGEMIRAVRAPDGSVSLSAPGHEQGRGAYLCCGVVCAGKARKKRSIERVLRAGAIDPAIYDELEEACRAAGE